MEIQFDTSNSAFDMYGDIEVVRILENIITKVKAGYNSGAIMDICGNKIGEWSL